MHFEENKSADNFTDVCKKSCSVLSVKGELDTSELRIAKLEDISHTIVFI